MNPILKIIVTAFLLLSAGCIYGQRKKPNIRVSIPRITLVGDSVHLSFHASADRLPPNYRVEFRPVLSNGAQELVLEEAGIAGTKNMRSAGRKRFFSSGKKGTDTEELVTSADTLHYTAVFPYKPWMNHYWLQIERLFKGCCSMELLPSCPIEGRLTGREELPVAAPTPVAPVVVAPVAVVAPVVPTPVVCLSSVDELAQKERFVCPADAFAADKRAGRYYRDKNALRIYFRQGQSVMDGCYMTNAYTLQRLENALNVIAGDPEVRVSRILIAGYASIEGTYYDNMQLSKRRADCLRVFAITHGINPCVIEQFNLGENWDELRELVAESQCMPGRDEVLRIIDTVPIMKGRELELMKLHGGVPYRWMKENFFPRLRNAGYIKVYFEKISVGGAESSLFR